MDIAITGAVSQLFAALACFQVNPESWQPRESNFLKNIYKKNLQFKICES